MTEEQQKQIEKELQGAFEGIVKESEKEYVDYIVNQKTLNNDYLNNLNNLDTLNNLIKKLQTCWKAIQGTDANYKPGYSLVAGPAKKCNRIRILNIFFNLVYRVNRKISEEQIKETDNVKKIKELFDIYKNILLKQHPGKKIENNNANTGFKIDLLQDIDTNYIKNIGSILGVENEKDGEEAGEKKNNKRKNK